MNLLITGAWEHADTYIPVLKEMGNCVRFLQSENDKLSFCPSWVEGIICNGFFLYHNIEEFCNLRFIQITSAGYDRIPMKYVYDHNISIYNARGVYSIPIAEYVISGILQIYKRLRMFEKNQNQHEWIKIRNLLELAGKIVAIIGCGNIGSECAKRLKAFDANVIGIDQIIHVDTNFNSIKGIEELDEILAISDVVVITLPLTDKTKGLFGKERVKRIKKGAILVNVSRGEILSNEAVINGLENNLAGVVLDVFEKEPLEKDNKLWNMENVIITPHNSFVGEGNGRRLSETIMSNLYDFSIGVVQ